MKYVIGADMFVANSNASASIKCRFQRKSPKVVRKNYSRRLKFSQQPSDPLERFMFLFKRRRKALVKILENDNNGTLKGDLGPYWNGPRTFKSHSL